MKLRIECVPCLLKQALSAAQLLELDEALSRRLMEKAALTLQQIDWDEPAPLMGRRIHRAIREITGNPDPYSEIKNANTDAALAVLPEVERVVRDAPDPFLAAVRFAIAGNVIDFGTGGRPVMDVEEAASTAQSLALDEEAVAHLKQRIHEARDVLVLADNAGEIVFDRPLLELIGADKLTIAVRGGPVINDATLDDARRSGLIERYNVITTGMDVPGLWLPECPPDFRERFDGADLVISLGQGNFETLSDAPRPVFFLFLVKCVSVAENLGVPVYTAMARTK